MDPQTFDALTRRAAGALTRRSLVGGVAGAVLAASIPPRRAIAKKGGNKGKKKCRKLAAVCTIAVGNFCQNLYPSPDDLILRDLCNRESKLCCGHYLNCKEAKGDQCLAGLEDPQCCPNADDVCCGAGSPVTCCPASFPMCPESGDPAICCPANAPFACENGSCTKEGFTCCPNNSGSCPTGQVCCDNDRCCPAGTTCVGTNQCE